LLFVLYSLFILDVLIISDIIGFNIPIFRSLFGFLFLTFIPGVIILLIIKLNFDSPIKLLLCSVCLSLSFLMIFGFLINLIYPFIGIQKPLTLSSVAFSINLAVIVLVIVAFFSDTTRPFIYNINIYESINNKSNLLIILLLLLLLPLISVCGSLMVDYYGNNYLLILLMFLIAIIFLLLGFSRFLPESLYPLAIFCISLSISYHGPFISHNFMRTDMVLEYLAYSISNSDSLWSTSVIKEQVFTMLSISILPVIYSRILGCEGIVVFKAIYPTLQAFIPLGLYYIYRKLSIDANLSLISVIFFISFSGFMQLSFSHARIIIGELFLMILLYTILDSDIPIPTKRTLEIIFTISLIFSYYALSYLHLMSLFIMYLSLIIINKFNLLKIVHHIDWIRLNFLLLTLLLVVSWNMYTADGVGFNYITHLCEIICKNILYDVTSASSRDPVMSIALGMGNPNSLIYTLMVWLYRLTQVFIVFGVILISIELKNQRTKFNLEFLLYSFAYLAILLFSIVQPKFLQLGITRLYQMALIFLSPFCIIGSAWIFDVLLKKVNQKYSNLSAVKCVILFIILPYFILNSGLIFEIANDHCFSYPLSESRMKQSDDLLTMIRYWTYFISDEEISGIQWIADHYNENLTIYADEASFSFFAVYGAGPFLRQKLSWLGYIQQKEYKYQYNGYFYLNSLATGFNVFVQRSPDFSFLKWISFNRSELNPFFREKSKIFSNNGCEIYHIYNESY